ncbi:MAG: hypothetical protein BGO63_17175 [Candidatus Accumulibacter sp. 66-26]|nr:MAG: hypothetical protein BGO63_17175 [Candidatus Accumulibacter sp. 66-26]
MSVTSSLRCGFSISQLTSSARRWRRICAARSSISACGCSCSATITLRTCDSRQTRHRRCNSAANSAGQSGISVWMSAASWRASSPSV